MAFRGAGKVDWPVEGQGGLHRSGYPRWDHPGQIPPTLRPAEIDHAVARGQ
jgi:hypothetical protein